MRLLDNSENYNPCLWYGQCGGAECGGCEFFSPADYNDDAEYIANLREDIDDYLDWAHREYGDGNW